MEQTTGVVVGYGSVGRRHAAVLGALLDELIIVEQGEDARARAREAHPGATIVGNLAELDRDAVRWGTATAVIATWGPSHADVFHQLAERGVKHVLCEKPMAASVADASAMAERARRDGITLGVHHYIRYASLVPALRELLIAHDLGEPVSVVVEGGAACLLTNGIHWVDFAIELFGTGPERVTSTASGMPINPRSPDLQLYGGTAVWSFPGGREAVITFSNLSSVALRARVYLRNAVVDIESDLSVTLRRRDPAAVAQFPAVTRTGPATEILFEGQLPGVLAYLDGMKTAAMDVSNGAEPRCPAAAGVKAVTACIGALVSASEGRAVVLPPAPGEKWTSVEWPIS